MKTYKGKSVCSGIAIGPLHIYQKGGTRVAPRAIEEPEAEIARYRTAVDVAKSELDTLHKKALSSVGEDKAAIFEVHQMLLEDLDYQDFVVNKVNDEKVCVEYAVQAAGEEFAAIFAAMEDEYMRARSADIRDVSERLVRILAGGTSSGTPTTAMGASILVAEDLAPSETLQLDKDKIMSFLTVKGSANSHTAILARTLGIPSLVKLQDDEVLAKDLEGVLAIVDGINGALYIDPSPSVLEEFKAKKAAYDEEQRKLQEFRGKRSFTKDGQEIKVFANIGGLGDADLAVENDAEGVGLFRSEFIYLSRDQLPTEEEQFAIYRSALLKFPGKKVVIRTLDIGADKECPYLNMPKEANPALGVRAIRLCLGRPDMFKTQLRALFRAARFGKLGIMYPMIISEKEIDNVKRMAEIVKAELAAEGKEFGDPEQGIMIETPAAAIRAAELAKKVDFFSIGTNDLSQYTLAIDRQNQDLDAFFDPHHPAVLKLLEMTVQGAHAAGITCGICGELGADTALTQFFARAGFDYLSVSPSSVLKVRKAISEVSAQ